MIRTRPTLPAYPMDRIRTIRKSLQCFTFGLFSLIPAVGITVGVEAIQIARQVARETGEPTAVVKLACCWLGLLAFGAASRWLAGGLGISGLSFALALAALIQFLLVRRQLAAQAPKQWNPARAQLHSGYALGLAGCFLPFYAIVMILSLGG